MSFVPVSRDTVTILTRKGRSRCASCYKVTTPKDGDRACPCCTLTICKHCADNVYLVPPGLLPDFIVHLLDCDRFNEQLETAGHPHCCDYE